MNRLMISITVLVGFALLVGMSAIFTVRETDQALVMQFGEPRRVITEPGLHFKIPFVQRVSYFDKRVLDFDAIAQEVPTQDQKQLVIDAFARYRITDPLLFFQTVRNELGIRQRLDSLINASLRAEIGEVSLATILTPERSVVVDRFAVRVANNSRGLGIEVTDVRIKRIDLPEENSQAIYRRMATQREQEARRIRAEGDKSRRTIRADADKRSRVIIAEARKNAELTRGLGDAKAQALYSSAYGQDIEFFDFWRSMQAMETALQADTTTFIGAPDSSFFRFFEQESPHRP